MAHLSIRLLGPMQVTISGEPVALPTDKTRALLAYLAVEAGKPHRRESLAGLLWAGQPERSARASLRRALADLRKAIGDDERTRPVLQVTRQTIGLDLSADLVVDVERFLRVSDPEATVQQLRDAVDIYAGHFLDGFSVPDAPEFDQWSLLQREHLQREASHGLAHLIEQLVADGEYDGALTHAWRRLEIDPWHEEAHRQVIRLLALNGQRSAALAQYETMTGILSDQLGVEPEQESRRLREQILSGEVAGVARAPAAMPRLGDCPYRGLSAFRETDSAVFFGRERLVERVAWAVDRQPVTVVVGPSGSGKSSIVYAGLIPRLRSDPSWRIVDVRPGSRPFLALAGASLELLEPERSEAERLIESRTLAAALDSGEVPVSDVVTRLLGHDDHATRLLLVVDQAEELYTLGSEPDVQRRFVDRVLDAVSGRPQVTLLLALRADFMGHALEHRRAADAFQDAVVMVGPMSRDEMWTTVVDPAEQRGASLEAGLVDRVLDDVVGEPGSLPLLEFALTLLWDRQTGGRLTHAAYDEIGHVDGALANYADQVLDRLDEVEQRRARLVFEQLVRPGEGTEDTRRIATRMELGDENWALVRQLADERLVVSGRDLDGRETAEVVHEALIQRWGRLQRWMESDRTFRTWQEGLRASLRGWNSSDHDEGALLHGGPLSQAEAWAAERGDEMGGDELAYIEASTDVRERRIAEAERRRRRTMLALSAGLVVAIVLAGVALSARSGARREADVNRSLVLAADVESAVQRGESDLAVALALEAAAHDDPPAEVQRALSVVAQAPGTRAVLTGHTDAVRAVAVGPDARLVVSGSCAEIDAASACTQGELIVWDLETGEETARLDGSGGWVNDIAFGPDGATVLTASDDGTIVLWDLVEGDSIRRLIGHDGGVTSVAFGPDGATALSGSDDATLILWDVSTGEEIRRLEGHRAGVTRVALGPAEGTDGVVTAISAANDSTVILWDLATGDAVRVFEGHEGAVTDVAFAPDGATFFSLAQDFTLRQWDVATGTERRRHELGAVPKSLVVRPDGRSLLMSVKTDLREWDVERWQELGRLTGHHSDTNVGAEIAAIAIDPIGRVAVSAGSDRTLRVWNLAGQVEQRRFDAGGLAMEAVAVSSDGGRIVTGMSTGETVVWDVAEGRAVARLGGEGFGVAPDCVAIGTPAQSGATDSRALVCAEDITPASDDTSLVLWDLEANRELRRFEGHITYVRAAAFMPDGRTALSGSQSLPDNEVGDLILWDLETGAEIRRFDLDHDVTSIAVNADGSRALTGSVTGFVAILWDVATGQEIRRFEGHTAPVLNVAFGPDEASVLTASFDGTLIRWDVETGAIVRRYEGHEADVWGLDVSPDERSMISSSADGDVVVWDLATGEERHRLQAHRSYVFDVAFGSEGNVAYSVGVDGQVIEWRGVDPSLGELVEWIRSNRFVRELTCEEREQYRLDTSGCPGVG